MRKLATGVRCGGRDRLDLWTTSPPSIVCPDEGADTERGEGSLHAAVVRRQLPRGLGSARGGLENERVMTDVVAVEGWEGRETPPSSHRVIKAQLAATLLVLSAQN